MYTFHISDTFIGFRNEIKNDKDSHYLLLDELLDFLKQRGFEIQTDPETLKHFSLIAEDYFYGTKQELEFKSHRYPSGFELEFYQSINIKNKSGGRYDFDKIKMMPYLIRLRFLTELKYIKEFLINKGCVENSKPKYKTAEDKIKFHFVDDWHHPQKDMNFNLSDLDGQTSEKYNHEDKDKKVIYNGQIKYFRKKNRLMRGKVYHNINNMWWIILNKYDYTNIASFELFDLDTEESKIHKIVEYKKYRNPKCKEYHNQEYRIGDNLFIFNERTGLFKANTDYGNYEHYWTAYGRDYKEFLIRLDKSYTLGKLASKRTEVNFNETIKEWKKTLLEYRRGKYIDKDQLRDALNYIKNNLEDNMSQDTLQIKWYGFCSDNDICDNYESFDVYTKYTEDVESFWKLFKDFQDILSKEIA